MCISRRFMVSRPYPAFPSLQHASGDQLAGVQEHSADAILQLLQPEATALQQDVALPQHDTWSAPACGSRVP